MRALKAPQTDANDRCAGVIEAAPKVIPPDQVRRDNVYLQIRSTCQGLVRSWDVLSHAQG